MNGAGWVPPPQRVGVFALEGKQGRKKGWSPFFLFWLSFISGVRGVQGSGLVKFSLQKCVVSACLPACLPALGRKEHQVSSISMDGIARVIDDGWTDMCWQHVGSCLCEQAGQANNQERRREKEKTKKYL
jgi:hypothetical protein